METEIKLRMPSEQDLLAVPDNDTIARLIMPDSRRELELINTYFDTPQRDLLAQKMSLRLRREGDAFSITIKSGGGVDNELHQRFEWTAYLPEDWENDLKDGLDTIWFKREATSNGDPDAQLAQALQLIKGHPLKELCETRFNRVAFDIGFGDSLMELALDFGELIAGNEQEPVCEMEVELKEGDVRDLVELSQEIQANMPAEPESRSKFARCIALLKPALRP